MNTILLAALIVHPLAGSYTGTYRAGFLNPRPCSVVIADEGTTTVSLSNGAVLRGDTTLTGAFDVRTRAGWRWVGSFSVAAPGLVGTFKAGSVSGVMWLSLN